MAKRFLIIVPVNKEAYLKAFESKTKADAIIQEKVGLVIRKTDVDAFERPMMMFSARGRKKSQLQVNDRATYYAKLPSAEDDIFGPAIIMGDIDGTPAGLTEKDALAVRDEINNLRIV